MNNLKFAALSAIFFLSGTALAMDPKDDQDPTLNTTSTTSTIQPPITDNKDSKDSKEEEVVPNTTSTTQPPITDNKDSKEEEVIETDPKLQYKLATTLTFPVNSNANIRNPKSSIQNDLTVYLRVNYDKISFGEMTAKFNPQILNHKIAEKNPDNFKKKPENAPKLIITQKFGESKKWKIKTDMTFYAGMDKEAAVKVLKDAGIFKKEVEYDSRKKNKDEPWYKPRNKSSTTNTGNTK